MELLINENKMQMAAKQITPVQTKAVTKCPRCGGVTCERIPRSRPVKILFFWLDLKHYRCLKCMRKFYKLS